MKVLLTIDWDYFVPEDPIWDLGHQESEIFLNGLWKMRAHLMSEMVATDGRLGFWKRLRRAVNFNVRKIAVSDSHLAVFDLLPRPGRVIMFDAHPDCWPGSKGSVDCASWARHWLLSDKRNRLIWIQPKWSRWGFPTDSRLHRGVLSRQARVLTGGEFLRSFQGWRIDRLHVCRSGCWTPPWLDAKWQAFVRASGLPRRMVAEPPWDGWRRRWTRSDFAEAKEMADAAQKAWGDATGDASRDR